MFKRILFFFLLPYICWAGDYKDEFRIYAESILDKNYNVVLSASQGVLNKESNVFFYYDLFYLRIIKDEHTWRLSNSFLINIFSTALAFTMRHPAGPTRNIFEYSYREGAIFLPSMLMNPTVGYQIAKPLGIAAGYNFDFMLLGGGAIYFAPKVQLELTIINNILLVPALSYQVIDCFATKQGLHFKVALVWFER